MIEYVQTEHGLMPRPVAERVDRTLRERRAMAAARREARLLAFRDRVANEFGIKASGLPLPTMEQITRAAAAAKAQFSRLQMAQAYPCRECRTAWDADYKARCATRGETACFLAAAFRGCDQFKSRPVTA